MDLFHFDPGQIGRLAVDCSCHSRRYLNSPTRSYATRHAPTSLLQRRTDLFFCIRVQRAGTASRALLRIMAPLVCATQTTVPLQQEFTRSVRPKKLHMRQLSPLEALSLVRTRALRNPADMHFDEDEAVYTSVGLEKWKRNGRRHCSRTSDLRPGLGCAGDGVQSRD